MLSASIILGILLGIPATMSDRLDLYEAYIDAAQYMGTVRHPLLSPNGYDPDKRLGLNLDVNMFKAFYWRNRLDAFTSTGGGQSQFRTIAWESEFGLRLSSGVDILIGHRSTHLMDDRFRHNDRPFFNEDWIGFRWYLKRKRKKRYAIEER